MIAATAGLLLSGACESSKPPSAYVSEPTPQPAPALALAFDTPSPNGIPIVVLARDNREMAAFGGFQTFNAEFFDVQTDDDQQFFDGASTYERRVLSDRIGEISR